MSGIGKDEDSLRTAISDVQTVQLVSTDAGWVVKASLSDEQVAAMPPEHLALLGQKQERRPAIILTSRTPTGDELRQVYEVDREPLAELIIELVGTYLDRSMFKQLVAVLPEDWSR